MICDTGPLVALLDCNDIHHRRCHEVIDLRPPEPFITTLACTTEALYFLGKKLGQLGQDALLKLIVEGELEIVDLTNADLQRTRELIQQYADLPMDFADATIVAVAERLNISTVFSLDQHFRIYRPREINHFDVVP